MTTTTPDALSDALPDELLDVLRSIVGDTHVVTDPSVTAGYAVDWTGRFAGSTPAVVRPGSTAEVAACLRACADRGTRVVPQGGNTGLVGGSVPLGGELVLSLRRLDDLGPVDRLAGQVTVGAGVTLTALQEHVRDAGVELAIDLAARDSATVGGMIATNAGGLHVMRHGSMRAQVVGIEAVLSSGAVVSHLGGLLKDNTGYDLAGLLCGSEGTLGVVTRARLKLVPRPAHQVVALLGMPDTAAAVAAVARWRDRVDVLVAAEGVLAAGVDLVCRSFGYPPPFAERWPIYLVLEAAGRTDPTDELASAVADDPTVGDVAVATAARDRAGLWRYRDEMTTAINTVGAPHKLDVTLPLGDLARFIDDVPACVAAVDPDATTWLFGHIGDGNIHVNVTGPAADDERTDEAVLRLVAERGGSISAEHGIGTAKRHFLSLVRSDAELAAFAAIKHALDPAGILNPGVLNP